MSPTKTWSRPISEHSQKSLLGAAGVAYGGPAGRVDGLGEVGVGEDDARVGRADAAQVNLSHAVDLALEEHEAAAVLGLPVLRGDGPQDLRPPIRLHEDLRALQKRSVLAFQALAHSCMCW